MRQRFPRNARLIEAYKKQVAGRGQLSGAGMGDLFSDIQAGFDTGDFNNVIHDVIDLTHQGAPGPQQLPPPPPAPKATIAQWVVANPGKAAAYGLGGLLGLALVIGVARRVL